MTQNAALTTLVSSAPARAPRVAESLEAYFDRSAREVNAWLDRLVPPAHVRPTTIHEAIRHSLFGGGKRVRPILTLAAGEAFGAPRNALVPVACAMELMHTASLIHDDLPAMDDADLRRGRPACHRSYGDAIAILAGDALIVRAFQVLASPATALSDAARGRVIAELAAAAGSDEGLIGGQVADLESEGKAVDAAQLAYIHRAKTGALIVASVVAGGIAAGAGPRQLELLRRYGERVGLAFQIVDDILDAVASSDELGKPVRQDVAAQKATYPALHGIEASRSMVGELVEEAVATARRLEGDGRRLEELAHFSASRCS